MPLCANIARTRKKTFRRIVSRLTRAELKYIINIHFAASRAVLRAKTKKNPEAFLYESR